jgi:hypothetical protein
MEAEDMEYMFGVSKADDNTSAKEVVVESAVKAIVDAVSSGISLGRQNRESLGKALDRDNMNSSAGRAIGQRQSGSPW